MRIQHNIMAMSAYRNYTNNVSAMKKNLEKLSSGYKINRAGDDAAGLAISEKMRAQITGLETAQKNAKDGISLVQTAEGALTEVHDMLNRMVELATQSANGTYDNTTDRAQMQKEINQLTDEINRIADSSNFNGIKLLNGDMDSGATEATTTWSDPTNLAIGAANNAHTGDTTSVGHALHKDGVERVDPSFTVDLTDVKFTAAANGKSFSVKIGETTLTIDKKDAGLTNAFAKGDTLSGKDLAKVIAAAANANESSVTGTKEADGVASGVLKGVEIGGLVYKATADGSSVKFELQTQDKNNAAINDQTLPADGSAKIPQDGVQITVGGAADGTLEGLDAGGHANTKITAGVAEKAGEMAHATFQLNAANLKDGTKLTIGNATYVFKIGADSTVKEGAGETLIDMSGVKADDAQLVDKAIALLTNQENDWFRLESGASGLLTAVEKEGYAGTGDLKTTEGLNSNFKISQMTVTAANAGDTSKGLTLQIGDTAETFNQLKVNIKDMHASSLGIDKNQISIADQTSAAAAVDKIKAAINKVSDVRGTLGATQNRLDHTINNLSVMTENIQDAESTIRDVDVAEEMMAYTKNNILIQSAQAMLAQANQVPQGVLQLLQ